MTNLKITLTAIAMCSSWPCASIAQTNFDVLYCRDATYTNATIIRSTPAYVVVTHQDGIVKVPLTNLPAALQAKYPYDPVAAQAVADAEKKREADAKLAVVKQRIATQKYLASLVGKTELISVGSVVDQHLPGGLTCEIESSAGDSTVLVSDLPASVLKYIQTKADITAKIDYLQNTPITATSTITDPNDPDPAFTAKLNSQDAADRASDSRDKKVDGLKAALKVLNDHPEKAMVRAYPTGQIYSQMMIWQCGESGK